jgi:hypothetical protein
MCDSSVSYTVSILFSKAAEGEGEAQMDNLTIIID